MFKINKFFYVILVYLIFPPYISFATPGDLDSTFNNPDGFVIYDSGNGIDDIGHTLNLQADGKILVAGINDDGNSREFLNLKYNSDGTPDDTFGTNGVFKYSMPDNLLQVREIAIQDNGHIIVLGSSGGGINEDILIYKYNSDGTPDNTFGIDGVVTYNGGNGGDIGSGLAFQDDGKIVVAGYSDGSNNTIDALVLRYNSDGTLDNTFGVNGVVTYDGENNYEFFYDLSIQGDGKIVLAGKTDDTNDTKVLVLRCNSDGMLDNTFGINGIVTYDWGNGGNFGNSLAIQSDGKILITGKYGDGSDENILLLRYSDDGTLDDSFGSNGVVTYDQEIIDEGRYLVIQADGKIIVAGGIYKLNPNYELDGVVVLRFSSDGTLDDSFGINGVVEYGTGDSQGNVSDLFIQNDGKILVLGSINNGLDRDIVINRYIVDSILTDSGGCFIQTVTYGTQLNSCAKILSDFRDIFTIKEKKR